jgi:two-component system sensor histidine kinase CreC
MVCFYYPMDWVLDNLRARYLEGVEDPLADQANILAAMLGGEMQRGEFDVNQLYYAFEDAHSRNLAAKIYDLVKTRVDMQMYITDAAGKIIFDSESRTNVGANYSRWRDVHLTLNGQYGARTTKKDINDKSSSVLYVAAPIIIDSEIAGVLTVAKPVTNINHF